MCGISRDFAGFCGISRDFWDSAGFCGTCGGSSPRFAAGRRWMGRRRIKHISCSFHVRRRLVDLSSDIPVVRAESPAYGRPPLQCRAVGPRPAALSLQPPPHAPAPPLLCRKQMPPCPRLPPPQRHADALQSSGRLRRGAAAGGAGPGHSLAVRLFPSGRPAWRAAVGAGDPPQRFRPHPPGAFLFLFFPFFLLSFLQNQKRRGTSAT